MKKVVSCIEFLDTGIFPAGVTFVYNKSWQEVRDYFKKQKSWDWFAGIVDDEKLYQESKYFASSRMLEDASGRKPSKKLFYITINSKFNKTNEDYIILAHEVTHLCQFILKDILDRDTEIEADAYLHSHLMRQILNIIAK